MNKYRAVRSYGFGSKLEAAVYAILKLRERAGEISDIRCQHSVKLGGRSWKCDFSYTEKGDTVFCEAKGLKTREFLWILEMWKLCGPGRLEIWGGSYQRPQRIETIEGAA